MGIKEKKEPFQIRDVFNDSIIEGLAASIIAVYPSFDEKGFIETTVPFFALQSYSERKANVTNALIQFLPKNYESLIEVLEQVLPSPYKDDVLTDTKDRFYLTALSAIAPIKGLDNFNVSIEFLKKITKCFTSEWDIRPFIEAYPERSIELLKEWSKDKNPHVRRLVSEGSRPYLPWGRKLKLIEENPDHSFALLHRLRNDPSEYVRRSVSNHLNDVTKKHPGKVVNILQKWNSEFPHKNMERLIKHALRTEIKKGNIEALRLIGIDVDATIEIVESDFPETLTLGSEDKFTVVIQNKEKTPCRYMLDYSIFYQKSNGTMQPKTFKGKESLLNADQKMVINKKISLKPISTRKYYSGDHQIEILINGKSKLKHNFKVQ